MKSCTARFVLTVSILLLGDLSHAAAASSPHRACCAASSPPDSNQFRIAPLPSLAPPTRPRHAVSFGVGYQPGPGLLLMGTYEFSGLPSGVLSLSAGWNERVFGAVSYTHLADLHLEPRWRLLASTTLFSRYVPNRLLGGTATDERRTGGNLRLELVGAYSFRRLQAFLALERARVWLWRHDAPDMAHWLTSVELGSQYTYARHTLLPEILLGARARIGWSDPKGRFVALLGAARFYHPLGGRFGVLLDARTQWVSPDAPLYEQASFGGMSSVRGYRADAAVGRHLWVIQNELWVPVPGLTGPSTLGELLRRYVRLAAFFDIGGIAETAGALDADVRTGLGVGLRLLIGPVTLRIDWGHRTPAVLDGHFQGNLYVSARSSLALLALW